MTASACLTLAAAHSLPIIDSGRNVMTLEAHPFPDPFQPDKVEHILETDISSPQNLSYEAFVQKMQLQYFDTLEDSADDDWSHIPTSIITHQISFTPRK